jgi:hypothetical protein
MARGFKHGWSAEDEKPRAHLGYDKHREERQIVGDVGTFEEEDRGPYVQAGGKTSTVRIFSQLKGR